MCYHAHIFSFGNYGISLKIEESQSHLTAEILRLPIPPPLKTYPCAHSSSHGSESVFELLSVVRIIWKRPSLSEQGPVSEAQIHRKLISWVCHRSMKLCKAEGSVTGAGALLRWRADGQGGEETLFSFTVEDRNFAVTRRTTGMPHIPQCWEQ